jgi:hydroxymethylbilane synthase
LAERALVSKIESGCRFPLGAVAVTSDDNDDGKMTLYASVFSADGERGIKVKKVGKAAEPEKLGNKVADMLVKQGAMKLAEGWRKAVEEWNSRL